MRAADAKRKHARARKEGFGWARTVISTRDICPDSRRAPSRFVSGLREKIRANHTTDRHKTVLDGFHSPDSTVQTVARGLRDNIRDVLSRLTTADITEK